MLSEYRELMTKLKAEGDKHFLKLFDEHNNLDTQIDNFEKRSRHLSQPCSRN